MNLAESFYIFFVIMGFSLRWFLLPIMKNFQVLVVIVY